LEGFHSNQQEKKRPIIQTASVNQIESEVSTELKSFQSYVKLIKETSVRIEELAKLLKSGEILENAYNLIMGELDDQLSLAVEDIFRSREVLELDRAKAKLEWAKEKIGFKETEPQKSPITREPSNIGTGFARGEYPEISKWKEIISKIDSTLSSLTIEEEASIIEQYLALIRGRFSQQTETEEIGRAITICRQRLNLISEKWASIRRSKIEQIINLELEAAKLKDEIKELEARFAVGELVQSTYESRTGVAQGSLKGNEKEIANIRSYIDDMDMKMFRCSELLR
jgi:hypothetical protein